MFTGSRTDAKINALSHPVVLEVTLAAEDFESRRKLDRCKLKQLLNASLMQLEEDISVRDVQYVEKKFVFNSSVVAKYHHITRTYDYRICHGLGEDVDHALLKYAGCLRLREPLELREFARLCR